MYVSPEMLSPFVALSTTSTRTRTSKAEAVVSLLNPSVDVCNEQAIRKRLEQFPSSRTRNVDDWAVGLFAIISRV